MMTSDYRGILFNFRNEYWTGMLTLSESAMLSSAWWIVLIPGVFLVVTLLCVTNIGNCLRAKLNQKERNI